MQASFWAGSPPGTHGRRPRCPPRALCGGRKRPLPAPPPTAGQKNTGGALWARAKAQPARLPAPHSGAPAAGGSAQESKPLPPAATPLRLAV